MEIWNETAWWVELIFNVCLLLIPALAALGTALQVSAWVRQAWKNVRQFVDEPGDLAIQLIAARTKYTPEQVSAFIVGNIDAVIAVLPEDE